MEVPLKKSPSTLFTLSNRISAPPPGVPLHRINSVFAERSCRVTHLLHKCCFFRRWGNSSSKSYIFPSSLFRKYCLVTYDSDGWPVGVSVIFFTSWASFTKINFDCGLHQTKSQTSEKCLNSIVAQSCAGLDYRQ